MFHPQDESGKGKEKATDNGKDKGKEKEKEKEKEGSGEIGEGEAGDGGRRHSDRPYVHRTLSNGTVVRLASLPGFRLPSHGPTFSEQWDPDDARHEPSFYPSTIEYMRNEWLQRLRPDHVTSAELHGKPFLLFFDERTRTWNTSEALDIDHVTQWRDHLETLGVDSRRDAMRAYNDLDNLRVVPATYNRGRDHADAILSEHGIESREWRQWVDERMRFDPDGEHPAYDPDRDAARRQRRTVNAEWDLGVSRKGLKFDDAILTLWRDRALKDAYAGDVVVPDPDHPDDRSKDHVVQLFQCSESRQYVTMTGLDIDHITPFVEVLEHMLVNREYERDLAQQEGRALPPPISRADVFDLYNNPENLRLLSRGVNSSHEFEMGIDGQYYDPGMDDPIFLSPEPTVIIVDDDEPIVYESMSDAGPDATRASDGPDREPGRGAKRAREDDATDDGEKEKERDPDEGPSPAKRARTDGGDAAPPDSREAVLRAMHPDDAAFFHQMRDAVAGLELSERGALSAQEQDNLAMGLVYAARRDGIRIDALAVSADERTLFGVQGALEQDTGRVGISIATFSGASMEVGAWAVANLRHASANGDTVPPPPDHHASHQHHA